MSKSDEQLLKLVAEHCTVAQVQDLLRTAKNRLERRSEIKVTAADKQSLINENLKSAIDAGRIDRPAVFDLVRNAEENGDQHIFYYRPRRASSAEILPQMAIDSVGTALIGNNWRKAVPSATTPGTGFSIADLRPLPGREDDWLLKVYALATRTHTGALTVINGRPYLPVIEETERIVLIARWRHPRILEIRVPRDSSRQRIEKRVEEIWKVLGDAFDRPALEAWDLTATRAKLIQLKDQNKKLYRVRDTRLFHSDSEGRYSFEGHPTSNDLMDRPELDQVIKILLSAGDECTHLGIAWIPRDDQPTPSRQMMTLVGERKPHELVLPGKCEAADVDYVTEQLRRFSRIS